MKALHKKSTEPQGKVKDADCGRTDESNSAGEMNKFNRMRKRLYEIMEPSGKGDAASKVYDVFMLAVIVLSLIPLAFKEEPTVFTVIDKVAAGIFILDYIARLLTADFAIERSDHIKDHVKKTWARFLVYPVTPMAIIDLLSILPSLTLISNAFRALKIFRSLRILRAFLAIRHSDLVFNTVKNVFWNKKVPLLTVLALAAGFILASALAVFNVEPETFPTFFDAVYWAAVSLTTVGYGDICTVTTVGRIVTILSSVFGVALIAMPSGILAAGFLEEFRAEKQKQADPKKASGPEMKPEEESESGGQLEQDDCNSPS